MRLSREFDETRSDCEVYIPDCRRIARLLGALREPGESVTELEELPEALLQQISSAAQFGSLGSGIPLKRGRRLPRSWR
jgi:hypothetical protein